MKSKKCPGHFLWLGDTGSAGSREHGSPCLEGSDPLGKVSPAGGGFGTRGLTGAGRTHVTGSAVGVCGLGGLRPIPPSPSPPVPLLPVPRTKSAPAEPSPSPPTCAMDTPGCPAFPPPRRPGGPPGLPRPPTAFALGAAGPHRRPPPLSPRPGRCPPLRAQPRYLGVASPGPPAVAVHGKPLYPPGAAGTRGAAGGWGGRGRRPLPAPSASLPPSLPRGLGFCWEPRSDPPAAAFRRHALPGFSEAAKVAIWPRREPPGRPPTGAELPSVATETGFSGMVPVLQKQGGKREKRRRERPGPAAATVGTGPGWGTAAPRYRGWRTAALPGAGWKVATGRQLRSPDPTGQERRQQPQCGRTDGPGLRGEGEAGLEGWQRSRCPGTPRCFGTDSPVPAPGQ